MRTRAFFAVALFAVLATTAASAQEYGDGVGIGGVFLPSGSTVLVGKTRIGSEIGIEVEVAFASTDAEDESSTEIAIGGGLLRYWNTGNEVQPYFAGRAGLEHRSYDRGGPGGEGDETSFTLGAFVGAEYFVNRRLSIEGETGVRLSFGSFGMATGTRLGGFLYF